MLNQGQSLLVGVFLSAAGIVMPASATTVAQLDAMSGKDAVNVIFSTGDKIASDIEAQDPALAQSIRKYLREDSPDGKQLSGTLNFCALEVAMKVVDDQRRAKDPKAALY